MSAAAYYPAHNASLRHYRDHVTASPEISPANPPSAPDLIDGNPTADSAEQQSPRQCSVRGCTKLVSPNSGTKMCETCRGRHRMYANTKRAKRKLEKAAIRMQSIGSEQQSAVWIPENLSPGGTVIGPATVPPDAPSDIQGMSSKSPELPPSTSELQSDAPSVSWNPSVIDPRLFASQSSELAGALTLPEGNIDKTPANHYHDTNTSVSEELPAPQVEASDALSSSFDVDEPPADGAGPPTSSSSPVQSSSSLPPRFCSVKGCKAIISGDYFFKMCESCRDRYRGYGITKRAKWKQERTEADAEMDSLRETEDKRRAEAGLPPLAEATTEEWNAFASAFIKEPQPDHATQHGHPVVGTRMCTVSHCHKLLPGHYKYRRCEQHRLQNRHHSNLKRVREKVVKALGPPDEFRNWSPPDTGNDDGKKNKDKEPEPLFTHEPMEIDRDKPDDGNQVTKSLDVSAIPPPARGTRRTNHVCSVKACFNLLSPTVPWKMCDACRAHDREVRRNARMRQRSMPEPSATQDDLPSQEATGNGAINAVEGKSTVIASSGTAEVSSMAGDEPSTPVQEAPNRLNDIFTDPLLPPDSSSSELRDASSSKADTAAPASSPTNEALSSGPTVNSTAPTVSNPATTDAAPAPKTRKKRASKKVKEKTSQDSDGGATKSKSASASAASKETLDSGNSATLPYPPYMAHMQPQYQVPYYMPPPYSMPPYTMPQQQKGNPTGNNQTTNQPVYPPPGYPPYHPYPYPPYMTQPYYPQNYGASQPQLQPYGSSSYPGQSQFQTAPPATSHYRRLEFKPQSDSALKTNAKRRKRKRADDQGGPAQKNQEANMISAATSSTSVFFAGPSTQPPTQEGREGAIHDSGSSTEPLSVEPGSVDVEVSQAPTNSSAESTKRVCGNKSCRRTVAEDSTGTLCEQCRIRIKKQRVKAKHRFKLEPRKQIVGVVGKDEQL